MHSTATRRKSSAEPADGLIGEARSGDRKAFDRLFRRYEETIFSFAFKVCRDRNDAEETLQDTYVNVFRGLKNFDGRSKFSTWLYSIVANNCLMKRRRGKLEKHSVSIDEIAARERRAGSAGPGEGTGGDFPAEPIPGWRNTPLEQAIDRELRARLDEAILKLPVEYRLVFILRDVEGRPAGETAKITGLSVPAVKSRLRRARVFLREELNDYMTR